MRLSHQDFKSLMRPIADRSSASATDLVELPGMLPAVSISIGILEII